MLYNIQRAVDYAKEAVSEVEVNRMFAADYPASWRITRIRAMVSHAYESGIRISNGLTREELERDRKHDEEMQRIDEREIRLEEAKANYLRAIAQIEDE